MLRHAKIDNMHYVDSVDRDKSAVSAIFYAEILMRPCFFYRKEDNIHVAIRYNGMEELANVDPHCPHISDVPCLHLSSHFPMVMN